MLGDQADVIWSSLLSILAEADMVPSDIVSITTYVVATHLGELATVMAARDRYLAGHLAASTLVTVPALARPEWLMEVALVAALPDEQLHEGHDRGIDQVARVLAIVRTCLLTVVLAVVILLVLALIVVPRVSGGVRSTVLSGSMRPTVPEGSVVVVRDVAADDLRVGDVITYQLRSGDPTLVTHRIVGITVDGTVRRSAPAATPTTQSIRIPSSPNR